MNLAKDLKGYANHTELLIDKQLLESEGIACTVRNLTEESMEFTGSDREIIAVLQVHRDDHEYAEAILNSKDRTQDVDYSIDDPEYTISCPECGSNHLYDRDYSRAPIFRLMTKIGSLLERRKTVLGCYNCDHTWESKVKLHGRKAKAKRSGALWEVEKGDQESE